MIFTDDTAKRYEDYADGNIVSTDPKNGIRYESQEILEDTILLLRYNCPDANCDVAARGMRDLVGHVRAEHKKRMCVLCTDHKKVFMHEHELFSEKDYKQHMAQGDDNPGAVDQSGFKGHPLCKFCGTRFFGDDELFVHCRESHERCFICDRAGNGVAGFQPQYWLDRSTLNNHFQNDHFPCMEPECVRGEFVVFASSSELKAHQLAEHRGLISKEIRRDRVNMDMADLNNLRTPYVEERRGGGGQREQREGRSRGRGRDPNAEPVPPSSAPTLRRDEQAFQRTLAIHSAQSVTSRTFGGSLTAAPTPVPSVAASTSSRTPATRSPANGSAFPGSRSSRPNLVESLDSAVGGPESRQPELTPEGHARQVRHGAVIERASSLLQNDSAKLTRFRNVIAAFQKGSINATAFIDTFFQLFSDTPASSLGTLIREVADLYEDKGKGQALRAAWNDWRAVSDDYPSLPPTANSDTSRLPSWVTVTDSSSSATSASPARTNRVLKLKSSTTQSSRSPVSQTRSWGATSSISAGPSSSTNASPAFPSLPASAQPNKSTNTRINTVPWTPSATSSAPSSAPPSRTPSRATNLGGAAAFPALPPAKPKSTLLGTIKGKPNTTSFAWGQGNGESSGAASSSEGPGEAVQGKKKGNKGKKHVLKWDDL